MAKKNKKIKRTPSHRKKRGPGPKDVSSQQRTLQQAMAHHQAGRLSQAESLYRQILSAEPDHPEALNFLGLLAHQVGKSDMGVELIKKALHNRPEYVDAFSNLGIIYNDLGKLEEAVGCFQQALTLKPDYAEVHSNLGNALKSLGQLEEAAVCFRKALALKPDYAELHYNLGNVLRDQGKLDEAAACFRKAIILKPHFVDLYSNLGNIHKDQGRLEEAAASFRQALTLKPDSAEVHYNLGNVLKDQGRFDEAVASYRRALSLEPNFSEVYNNLGNVLKDQGKLDEAVASFRQALTFRPDSAELHNNLGNTLKDQGEMAEAVASFQRALTLKPDFTEAHNSLGIIYRELGKMDDAIACFRKALSLKPDYAVAFRNLSLMVKYTEVDDDIIAMEDLYKKGDIPDAYRIDLGFALGKVYESLKDYDKSFNFILAANRLKRGTYQYTSREDHDLFARIKNTFSTGFLSSHHGCGNQNRTPIFIIGMPRSGTTLVEQILASHPQVFGAGELAILRNLINDICTGKETAEFPECMTDLGLDEFERMGGTYIEKIRKYSAEAEYITDKLPYNFMYVGVIKTILPAAKVIHCERNPMDTCFSIYKNDFIGTHKYAFDLIELGQYYNLYRDLMTHWEKVLPGYLFSLQYENIVSDQQGQTKDLLNFCELPWDDACLSFHKTERTVSTASLTQVRQPIYKDSVELWKRYEKQLEPLRKTIYG